MRSIQNAASALFICAVAVLSVICVLGVWDFFTTDVIVKSFQTLGLLAIVAVVVIVAGRFVGGGTEVNAVALPHPIFKTIRVITLGVLIISAVLLAFLGICAIWDIITDKAALYKSLSSLAILAFSAFIIVITCLEREDSPLLKRNGRSSAGTILVALVVMYIIFAFISLF